MRNFYGECFISINDYTTEELTYMLDVADFLKAQKKKGIAIDYLRGKTLGMIFQKNLQKAAKSGKKPMSFLILYYEGCNYIIR